MTKPKTHRFDTLSLHAGCGARSRDRRAGDADLPDRVVRLSRQRSRGGAVQHGARRPRLFAHLQPDGGGARGADRRARRRRRRHRDGERTGGAAPGDRDPAGRGLAHRRVALAVRRLAQSARLHAAALRHHDDLRRSARPRRLARGDPARNAPALRRNAGQSGPRRARHSARGRARARPRAAAARRFDVHDALPDAAVRTRRRSRLPFGDQVPVGARRRDRRRAGRLGALRLGRQGARAASSRR